MPRTGWVLRDVKDPETIAEHGFLLAIASWILSRKKRLNLEKVLKMSLVYEICKVYAGDATPYDKLLPSDKKEEILKTWPRFPKRQKKKRFLEDYRNKKRALRKLTSRLPLALKKEIIDLWDECRKRRMPEGNFVNQVYWVMTYLQALQYFEKNKKFPILAWHEQMQEFVDEPTLLEFLKELEEKFLSGSKITF